MKKCFGKLFLWIADPLILWCFGWKRKRVVYHFGKVPVQSVVLWTDPAGEYGHLTENHAIEICEKRIRS